MNKISNIINEEIQNFIGENQFGYHVTRRKNLPSINKIGLEPRVPEDFGMEGDIKGVYLFKNYDDMINALYNWLGERIEEWEEEYGEEYDEVGLKIDLNQINPENIHDTVEYEWTITETIPPEAIVEILKV
jgi:hypothetical protein